MKITRKHATSHRLFQYLQYLTSLYIYRVYTSDTAKCHAVAEELCPAVAAQATMHYGADNHLTTLAVTTLRTFARYYSFRVMDALKIQYTSVSEH